MYNIFCGICHGESGNGLGYLADPDANPQSKYPVVPANFLNDEFLAASNGRYYHAIMYGKNVMGAYKDKMSYEERWQVIHYIRALQAKEKKLAYGPEVNTLNPEFGTPVSQMTQFTEIIEDDQLQDATGSGDNQGEHDSDGDHNNEEH